MKFVRTFPAIRAGQHAGERIYRSLMWQPCTICGDITDWVDTRLHVPVCSEECEYTAVTRSARRGPATQARHAEVGAPGAGGPPPRYVIVIQRGHRELFETLARSLGPENVRWDRRQAARRATTIPVGTERRRSARRREPGVRSATAGFVALLASQDGR